MNKIAHQPGKRLEPSNGGTGPNRWQGSAIGGVKAAAIPTGPLYDEHGWQPNGVHRKTGTAVSPEGVPFSFSKTLRASSPSITEAEVASLHRTHVPVAYAEEGLRNGLSAAEVEELHAEHAPRSALRPRRTLPPSSATKPDSTPAGVLRKVPVVRNGVLTMENRRVLHQNRDEAHKTDREHQLDRVWGHRKPKPIEPWMYAPMPTDPDGQQPVRIPFEWRELRSAAKRLGAKWDRVRKVWRMAPEAAEQLRPLIEQRATAEGSE